MFINRHFITWVWYYIISVLFTLSTLVAPLHHLKKGSYTHYTHNTRTHACTHARTHTHIYESEESFHTSKYAETISWSREKRWGKWKSKNLWPLTKKFQINMRKLFQNNYQLKINIPIKHKSLISTRISTLVWYSNRDVLWTLNTAAITKIYWCLDSSNNILQKTEPLTPAFWK